MHARALSASKKLIEILWGWSICVGCEDNLVCPNGLCPAARYKRLQTYLTLFHSLAATYDISLSTDNDKSNVQDVCCIIQILKNDGSQSRDQVTGTHFSSGRIPKLSSTAQALAVRLAVQSLLMLECPSPHSSLARLESGDFAAPWSSTQSLHEFVEKQLPQSDHPIFAHSDVSVIREASDVITACNLCTRAHLLFKATNNINRHLHLDAKYRVVEIFHHTSFLKECLLKTKEPLHPLPSVFVSRQLALEILDSIQKILFPQHDKRFRNTLQSLVSKADFDPDCLRFESKAIRTDEEKDVSYRYLGERLAVLLDEVQNPRPYGLFEKWLERKSGARYVMFATLIGVIFAVLLGIAALGLSGYQTWIAYQAWKHPVPSSPDPVGASR